MMRRRWSMWALGRLLLAAFCWATAAYAWVASSTFALLQFLRPRVFPWVGSFSDWHPAAAWVAFAALAGLAWHERRRPAAALAWPLVIVGAAGVVWNSVTPILPRLEGGDRSILVGVLALVPAIWYAVIDHVDAVPLFRAPAPVRTEDGVRASEARLLVVAVTTALFATALYAVMTSALSAQAFEPDLLTPGLVLGLGWSLLDHVWIAAAGFVLIAAVSRLAAGRRRLEYALLFALFVATLAATFHRLVGDALGMQGKAGALAAIAFAISVVGTWAGLRLRWLASERRTPSSALDPYLGTPGARRTGALSLIALAAGLAVAGVAVSRVADWDFVILRASVVAVWLVSAAALHQLAPARLRLPAWALATGCILPLAALWTVQATSDQARVLARYEVYNPSFRVTRSLLHTVAATPSFDRFLRDNTNLGDVLPPTSIDFVSPLAPLAPADRPPIFLFVVDSLRPDYLGAYNAAVRFTPRLDAFAADSVVFRNAFTRFGGTGLSLPAIWAGAALAHKQYVLPFAPANALEKVIAANGYRQLLDLDSIMARLLPPDDRIEVLDPGAAPANHEWCGTLEQIAARVASPAPAPVFGYALPQDIHMSRLPRRVETGPEYRDFHAPYATKVHAIDACFGRFVDALKSHGLYERSVIVVTADHGEMLGEDGRFGHSTHLFPQVIEVPLIVHLPARVQPELDVNAVSLTTDITPTIYAALGYRPSRANPLMGRSLLDTGAAAIASRRLEPVVIASSYGPVYATLRANGRRLYIADGINGTELAYERGQEGRWREAKVTRALRTVDQFLIRQYIGRVSRTYHVPERP